MDGWSKLMKAVMAQEERGGLGSKGCLMGTSSSINVTVTELMKHIVGVEKWGTVTQTTQCTSFEIVLCFPCLKC